MEEEPQSLLSFLEIIEIISYTFIAGYQYAVSIDISYPQIVGYFYKSPFQRNIK